MSRGFVKEGDQIEVPAHVPRAPLPPNTPNYVRPEGLAKLQAELAALQGEYAQTDQNGVDSQARSAKLVSLNARLAELKGRIATAKVVSAGEEDQSQVRFGATVSVKTAIAGKALPDRTFTIVGVDEADIKEGMIAFTSPLARALQGLKKGGKARLRTGRGEEMLEVAGVSYS